MHLMAAHQRDIFLPEDAAFGDDDAISRYAGEQIEGVLQAHFEGAQVAVVDAYQRSR